MTWKLCAQLEAAGVVAALALAVPATGWAATATNTETFTVTRNGSQIGTHTISIARDGNKVAVRIATHVEIKLGFLTLYHFDQTDNEQWSNQHLVTLQATTDDNGTVHSVGASDASDGLVIEATGSPCKVAATTIPVTLWNPALLESQSGFDPISGKLVKISVSDRGADTVQIKGRAMPAHHYVVTAAFAQDVWYDKDNRLVKVALKGRDGSVIQYQID